MLSAFARHSGAGEAGARNPVLSFDAFKEVRIKNWISAFAGMTMLF